MRKKLKKRWKTKSISAMETASLLNKGGFETDYENNPKYIGRPDIPSPKHKLVEDTSNAELGHGENEKPNEKAIVFCRYIDEVETYRDRFIEKYGAAAYYGGLSSEPGWIQMG